MKTTKFRSVKAVLVCPGWGGDTGRGGQATSEARRTLQGPEVLLFNPGTEKKTKKEKKVGAGTGKQEAGGSSSALSWFGGAPG